jgi:membrane glycosyltransferase
MFAVGAFSYGVAPLWLVFLALGLAAGGRGADDTPLWALTVLLLLLPRVLSAASIVARGEAAAFGGTTRLAAGALLELVLSSLQAPLRMLAHSVFVLGALTGLKLEWKSPPRAAEAPSWGDASRRVGSLVLLPLAAGLGLMRRAATMTLAPMLLPLSVAVPFVVLTGHPRAGRFVHRLGLLRLPEDRVVPRPLLRVAECRVFDDLRPAPAVSSLVAPAAAHAIAPRRGMRLATSGLVVAAATFALILPRSGIAPERPADGRQPRLLAYSDAPRVSLRTGHKPTPRRRKVSPDKPARMIDDALRRRAMEAVERARAWEDVPV